MTEAAKTTQVAKAVPLPPTVAPVGIGSRGLELRTLEDLYRFAKLAVMGGLAPKGDTIEAAACKIVFGRELGLSAAQSLTALAHINGRCSLYGDGLTAVLMASGKCVHPPRSEMVGKPGTDEHGCRVTLRRKDCAEPIVKEFTVSQAKKAGLWGKSGPWTAYPERMLYWRALSWAAREGFPDVLRGIAVYEEQADVIDMGPVEATTKPEPPVALPVSAQLLAPASEVPSALDVWAVMQTRLEPIQMVDLLGEIKADAITEANVGAAIAVARRMMGEVADD